MGELPKIGGKVGQFADLMGAWQKRDGWCLWGGEWYLNAHCLSGKNKVSYIIYRGTKTDDVIFNEF